MQKDSIKDLRSRNLRNIAFITILVIVALLVLQSWYGNKAPTDEISFTSFETLVKQGKIVEVNVREDIASARTVEGETVTVRLPPDPSTYKDLFTPAAVDATDPASRRPDVKYDPPSSSGLLLTVFVSLLPILLLIGVWVYIMRRTQAGAGGALSFGQSKAKLVAPDSSKTTFADVAGLDEVKEEVEEIVEYLGDQRRFSKLGAEIPKGILLVGAPGTGKTLLAKAIAGEAKVPFFSISGSDFVEMFVGVGAARVRDMFEKAKASSPCIIFIDEIDAVGRKRGAGLGGGHDEREQTLNQLLAEMDGFQPNKGIIILAATNRPDVLDPALLRPGRFDRSVQLPYPALRDRVAILKVHLKTRKVAADVDAEILARKTPGFVGADLRNLCNEAALLAARKNKEEVEMSDFEEATDRLYPGLRRKSVVPTDKERRVIAYHESGHTLLGFLLKPGDVVVHKVSILPRSHGSLGVTQSLPLEERFLPTEQEFKNELAGLLGGRAAEEVVFEEFAAGSGSDLRSATQLATRMVIELGMNEELGPISLGSDRVNVFLGEDIVKGNQHSDETSSLADREIRRLLLAAYEKAKGLLVHHRDALDHLAEEVLAREEISGDDLTQLLTQLLPSPAEG
ncbi:MAG: ATP-dependent zinc metalloprotease FtsH [bacterium]